MKISQFLFSIILALKFKFLQRLLETDEPEYSVEPRLITVTSTITTSIYSTVTSTAAATQTLVFTSANNNGCIPRGLLSSLSIPQC